MNKLICRIVKKYETRNPIEIARQLGIDVVFEPIGSINGYYNSAYRIKSIHINSDLPEYQQNFIAAHELGHALLHPKANTPFMRSCTYFRVDKFEIEANAFAVNLLISDEMISQNRYLTLGQMSMLFGIHEKMMELRIKYKYCKEEL